MLCDQALRSTAQPINVRLRRAPAPWNTSIGIATGIIKRHRRMASWRDQNWQLERRHDAL